MTRYIDADALREDWLENGENEHIYDTNDFLNSIDNAPTADVVEVRHGRWEERPVNVGTPTTGLFCGECDFPTHGWKYNFCPNCGVKMDEGEQCDPD